MQNRNIYQVLRKNIIAKVRLLHIELKSVRKKRMKNELWISMRSIKLLKEELTEFRS